jgi:hypothetical protein
VFARLILSQPLQRLGHHSFVAPPQRLLEEARRFRAVRRDQPRDQKVLGQRIGQRIA